MEVARTIESDPSDADETNGATVLEGQRARVDGVSDARLVQLFSMPRKPQELIAGLRVLGFTAGSVEFMTAAKSRDVVYSWAAGRAKPGLEQAKRLDEIRHILYYICSHPELGPESAWMLFNAKFATMAQDGPTAMELIAKGGAASVLKHVESLVDDDGQDGGEGPTEPDPPAPSPTSEGSSQPARTKG